MGESLGGEPASMNANSARSKLDDCCSSFLMGALVMTVSLSVWYKKVRPFLRQLVNNSMDMVYSILSMFSLKSISSSDEVDRL